MLSRGIIVFNAFCSSQNSFNSIIGCFFADCIAVFVSCVCWLILYYVFCLCFELRPIERQKFDLWNLSLLYAAILLNSLTYLLTHKVPGTWLSSVWDDTANHFLFVVSVLFFANTHNPTNFFLTYCTNSDSSDFFFFFTPHRPPNWRVYLFMGLRDTQVVTSRVGERRPLYM